ncbi:MAG: hypothetical protein AAB547_01620 [Patescibacteria group bacterium]
MLVAMGGIMFVGATLPGLVKGIGTFSRSHKSYRKTRMRYSEKQISNSFAYLKKKQLIKLVQESGGKITVQLTNQGEKRLTSYSLDMLKIKKPKKWDGKWRVLMFDIPTHPKSYNSARDALRNKIKELGFYQIQKSVWVYPYECEDELLFVAEMFKVQRYIEILTADRMLHENVLKKKFALG